MSAVLLVAILGCSGSQKKPAPTIPPPTREMPSEAPENQPEPGTPPAFPTPGETQETPSGEKTRYGYRIQVAAFTETSKAEERAQELRGFFEEPIYVVAEGLLYKVQVGDFVSRDKADSVRRRAIDLGLDGAFVVDTMIREP
jgi:cell division septation protein DedD